MNNYEIEAFISDKKIGTLLLKDGIVYFEYDKEFKQSGLELSPIKLPLNYDGVYINTDDTYFETLPGLFHDTLPDKFGTKVIERYFESKGITPNNLNVLQKLMFVGNKSIGAISYKPIIDDIKKDEQLIDIHNYYLNAKKIIQGDEIDAIGEMLTFMDSAASAGGARAKATIAYNKTTKEIISSMQNKLLGGYEHYLIKFDMENEKGGSSDFTKLEYIYMSFAKKMKIDVPPIELIQDHSLSHFLIKRFDRKLDEKIHLHSVAGLTHSNFNIPKHYSYDQLLKLTRYLTKSQQAVWEQYKRMVFNIISRNQDDHAKNFSFMMEKNGKWDISPAYDITYANGQGYTKQHQLSLKGKTDNFILKDLLDIAALHSIKLSNAKEYIQECIELFSTFSKEALQFDIDKNFIKEISQAHRLDIK